MNEKLALVEEVVGYNRASVAQLASKSDVNMMSSKDTTCEAAADEHHVSPPSLPATDDPRVLLGVGLGAGAAEIKQAYRSLVLQYHPDKGGTSADFQRIHAAAEALGVGGGERPCVAPARQNSSPGYAAARVHQLPLPCASHPSEWRLQEAANSMGYRYLCVVHAQEGPCLALHRGSLGGFQWRRRRPDGRGWFDAEAFADGQGSIVSGMVNMIGAVSCSTVAQDDRAQRALECDRQYEWGNWELLLTPGSDDSGRADLVIHNRKLSRSPYSINLTSAGLAIFTDTGGGSHNLC